MIPYTELPFYATEEDRLFMDIITDEELEQKIDELEKQIAKLEFDFVLSSKDEEDIYLLLNLNKKIDKIKRTIKTYEFLNANELIFFVKSYAFHILTIHGRIVKFFPSSGKWKNYGSKKFYSYSHHKVERFFKNIVQLP